MLGRSSVLYSAVKLSKSSTEQMSPQLNGRYFSVFPILENRDNEIELGEQNSEAGSPPH